MPRRPCRRPRCGTPAPPAPPPPPHSGGTPHPARASAGAPGPPPAPAAAAPPVAATSAAGVRALLVFGLGNLQPLPGFQDAAALCAADAVDTKSKRRARCLHLARTLVWAGAPLARSLGLHIEQTLSRDPAQRQQARNAWRDLAWQIRHFGQLTLDARHDVQRARNLLHLARQGGTQMSLILAALRAAHIPIHAPAGWEPRRHAPSPAPPASASR